MDNFLGGTSVGESITNFNNFTSEKGLMAGVPWLGALWDEISGRNSQKREFEQQEHLLEKEQEFSDERNRMDRLIEAGVNPNVAASGVAGSSSSPSAPPVSNSGNRGADALNALSGVANAATSGAKNIADAAYSQGTLIPTIEKLTNESLVEFEKIGLTRSEAICAAERAKYASEDELLNIRTKRVNLNMFHQELKNKRQVWRNLIAEQDEILSRTDLNVSMKEYHDALKVKTDLESREFEDLLNFLESAGWSPKYVNSIDGMVGMMLYSGKSMEEIDTFLDKWCDYTDNLNYAKQKGVNRAEVEDVFNKTWNAVLANNQVNQLFKAFDLKLDLIKDEMFEAFKVACQQTKSVTGVGAVLETTIKLLTTALSSVMVEDKNLIQDSRSPQTLKPRPPKTAD